MDKTAKKITVEMLRMVEDHFGNHMCNDYELDCTPENLAFVEAMEKWNDPEWRGEINISADGRKIYTMDYFVFAYCAHLLEVDND